MRCAALTSAREKSRGLARSSLSPDPLSCPKRAEVSVFLAPCGAEWAGGERVAWAGACTWLPSDSGMSLRGEKIGTSKESSEERAGGGSENSFNI